MGKGSVFRVYNIECVEVRIYCTGSSVQGSVYSAYGCRG